MIPSPCIGLCQLDPATRLCVGCARSGAEVAAWRDADPADRARVWADLPRRRAALGIALSRKGWSPSEALAFVRESLTPGRGSWTVGLLGASARFAPGGEGPVEVVEWSTRLTVSNSEVVLRFDLDDRVRVLAVSPTGGEPDPNCERIILAVPKTREIEEPATALTPLGPDLKAIYPVDRAARWFDLGVGQLSTRVGLRTRDETLAANLAGRSGDAWHDVLTDLGEGLRHDPGTTWVVETPLVRAEVAASGTFGPTGPFRLDFKALALDRPMPLGLDLPPTFVPCALFDPAPTGAAAGLARWWPRLIGQG